MADIDSSDHWADPSSLLVPPPWLHPHAGTLSPERDNAVLVCHALTGDAHAAGPAGDGHPTPGWWDDMIGPGKPIDTDRWFVVCANVLGGCQGTTGPASPLPDRLGYYGPLFPVVSIRDIVRTQARLADALKIQAWHSVIGGSMGGMQALEWSVMYPERVGRLVVIASCAAASAQQIAWWSTGRRAIALDPKWRDGHYYDTTGCGNTLNFGNPHVIKMAMDSLRYWVEEFHIDGFRFDLPDHVPQR